jgi:hypothetical protein
MILPLRDPRGVNASGLFVDRGKVECYRPARRR